MGIPASHMPTVDRRTGENIFMCINNDSRVNVISMRMASLATVVNDAKNMVKGQRSKVKGQGARVKNQRPRTKDQGPRVKGQGSRA